MTSSNLKVLLATLILGSGCSQILGLGDYEIDGDLDHKGSGGDENPGQGGDPGQGGNDSRGGKSQSGDAGMGAREPDGGSAPMPMAGASTGGGAGEEAGAGGQGQGGAGSELIPCTSADCCIAADGTAVSEELLQDGSFELGPVSEGNPFWTHDSTTMGLDLIYVEGNGWAPRTGTYFAYLSGFPNEESFLWTEDVTIPEGIGWLELTGYRRFQIDLADENNLDYATINFYGYEADSPDEHLFDWGDPSLSKDGWGATVNWFRFAASWDATPHLGAVRYLAFSGVSDGYPETGERLASAYLYDDLSLKAYRCVR